MRDLTVQQRDACAMQAEIFEKSTKESEDGSAVFIRRFMYSSVAARMDANTLANESGTIEQIIHEVDSEYGGKPYGSKRYSCSEMHWIGYIYRYLCFVANVSSKRAYKIIGARELRDLYLPYHSLDPGQAVERILEARALGTRPQDNLVSRGVEVLRRIRS